MPRLTTEFWVEAYLRRLRLADIAHYLIRRGDAQAGAVMVKLATLDGRAMAWERAYDPASGGRRWITLAEGEEALVDAALARARARDPDLWLIEIEDRQGRSLLEEEGLSGD
ncbi:DUF1491 family protein [Pseudogemmobacter sonorensis]|uniref:DUF1491 family protein n=1 Tax=Pseudogemmobacter sonorensis TaxID=2989681 RepID=UPI0036B0F7B9